MTIQARAAIVRRAGDPVSIEPIHVDDPGPGEILVRVVATGVCHTDLHVKLGNAGTRFPYVLGHEATAVVEELGEGVAEPAVGTIVVLTWRAPCRRCRYCVAQRPEFCLQPQTAQPRMRTTDGEVLGRVLGLGTFATHTVVAAAQAIPIPVGLPPEATALVGCAVGTGVGAVLNAAKVDRGSTVAVFGCGTIGACVIQGARLAGAARIFAIDRVERKLAWAREFGATDTVDATIEDAVAVIKERTGSGVTYAFECVGLPQTLQQAMASCESGGLCVMIGVPTPTAELPLSMSRFFQARGHLKATFFGDCVPERDIPAYVERYRRGELDLDRLVTARISLDDLEDAFARLERGEVLRSVVVMGTQSPVFRSDASDSHLA